MPSQNRNLRDSMNRMDNAVVFVVKMSDKINEYVFVAEKNLDVSGHSIYFIREIDMGENREPLKLSDPCEIMGTLIPDSELYKKLNLCEFTNEETVNLITQNNKSYVQYKKQAFNCLMN